MKIDNFIEVYGTSPKRRELINLLSSELSVIQNNGWSYKAYVFGSLINSNEPNPNDIDCLLSVSLPHRADFWSPTSASIMLDIWPQHINSTSIYGSSCLTVDEMVDAFNECCKKTGEDIEITPDHCMEIALE